MFRKLKVTLKKWWEQEKDKRYPNNLAVLAIAKNESMVIKEWIEHYLWQGAEKVFIIDNGSTDSTIDQILEFKNTGKVEVISLPERHKQRAHYWTAINHFRIRQRFRWLLVADVDEFWFCKDGRSVGDALNNDEFRDIDVIYVSWSLFGSNGLKTQPKNVRTAFTKRSRDLFQSHNTKYVCRTKVLRELNNLGIHKINGVDSSRKTSANQTFQLNHYAIQSLEYFTKVKMTRGAADHVKHEHVRDLAYFERYDQSGSEVEDRLLADRVKEAS